MTLPDHEPIRVLLCDDSAVIRGLLTRAIEKDGVAKVVGSTIDGAQCLQWLRRHTIHGEPPVDVVVLDVDMPVMDGIATLRLIHDDFLDLPVIMASSLTYRGAETTVQALSYGAVGCVAKPVGMSMSDGMAQIRSELIPLIQAVVRRDQAIADSVAKAQPRARRAMPAERQVLVIGSSTGGPRALNRLLTSLPADFATPILIAQHMPPLFTPMLAQQLECDTGRTTAEGVHGELIQLRRTYVAPGSFHMELVGGTMGPEIRLHQGPEEHFCRPSVNPLFRSAAQLYGERVIAVMLTGMGDDGIEGTRAVAEQGGYVIAQDQSSSVVWGMPGAVVRAELADEVLPLGQIAAAIRKLQMSEVLV